jgi:putative transposase
MAYSEDLKQRVLGFVKAGGKKTEAVKVFKVSKATVFRWLAEGEDHVRGKPGPKGRRKIDMKALEALVKERPDLLGKEMAAILGTKVATVYGGLKDLGLRRKKKR